MLKNLSGKKMTYARDLRNAEPLSPSSLSLKKLWNPQASQVVYKVMTTNHLTREDG